MCPTSFEFEKILLIDDNDIDNFISAGIISKLDVAKEIISKTSAEDALEYLASCIPNYSLPEIILLDIRMPSMDGFDFLREFAKFPPAVHAACKIFILSSSVDSRDIERAKKNPYVLSFITKPLTFDSFQKALTLFAQHKQSHPKTV